MEERIKVLENSKGEQDEDVEDYMSNDFLNQMQVYSYNYY